MTSVTRTGGTATFTYDALGLPISREEGGVTDSWVWNYATGLASPSVLKRDGNTLRYYVHTPDGKLLYSIDEAGGVRRWYHFDEAGNTLFLSDAGGQVTDSYAYTPYGRVVASTGTTENPFTFAGALGVMAEGNDGLYRMRQRVYDSTTRRFLSRDPYVAHTDPRELNPYVYALGNPIRFQDATGEEGQSDATTGTQLGANMLGTLGAVIEKQIPGISRVGWTRTLGKVGKAGKVLGAAGTAVSAIAEVAATNERMDRVTGRFSEANKAIREAWNQGYRALQHLYSTKRVITRKQFRELLKKLNEERKKAEDKAKEKLNSSSVRVGVIAGANLATNLVPGLGLVLDWSDHIDF